VDADNIRDTHYVLKFWNREIEPGNDFGYALYKMAMISWFSFREKLIL